MSDWAGAAASAGSGAATGAAAGSVFGPIGTGVGAIGGALISGITSLVGGGMTNAANARAQHQANLANYVINQEQTAFNEHEAIRNRAFNSMEAQRARDFAAAQAAGQMQFQRESQSTAMGYNTRERLEAQAFNELMSNTAWRRGVADMRAAGINPILAASRGGASSPETRGASVGSLSGAAASGTAASGSPASAPSFSGFRSTRFENALGDAVTTALRAMGAFQENAKLEAGLANTDAQTRFVLANAEKVKAETEFINTNTGKNVAETKLTEQQITNAQRMFDQIGAQIGQINAMAGLNTAQANNARELQKQLELETERFRNYGPKGGFLGSTDTAASIEAGARRLGAAVADFGRSLKYTPPAGRENRGFFENWGENMMENARKLLDIFR